MDLRGDNFIAALKELKRRAEHQVDDLNLYNTFVDSGVMDDLSNSESQIIYGRRGVGKTHLLHFHRRTIGPEWLYLIFDCRRLGSGLSVISEDPFIIARNYVSELLNDLATKIYDSIPARKLPNREQLLAEKAAVLLTEHISTKNGGFDYRNISATVRGFLEHTGYEKLFIALDEFVHIPQAAQPYVLHHLKLIFATEPNVIFKIATLTYQTTLVAEHGGQRFGMDAGADAFNDINLDNHLIWDENEKGVRLFFAQVLYNHLGELLGWQLGIDPNEKLRFLCSNLFTQEKCFDLLVRASEGNCRDMFNILKQAHSEFRRGTNNKIGMTDTTVAAGAWYRESKLTNLSPNTQDEAFLRFLIQTVIKDKKSRAFMVPYSDAKHPLLNRLLNVSLLHRMRKTGKHADKPGEPYHIFIMDYGCYADLKGTNFEPEQEILLEVEEGKEADDDLVPVTDRRSIRRIVVERADLDRFYVKL